MFSTRKLAYIALFTALNTLANILSIPLFASNYISFVYVVCFLAAAYLGIIPAVIVAFLGDLLGCFIAPKGDINLIILLASTLLGLIPALIFKIKGLDLTLKIIIALVLCTVLCTSFLNTFALWFISSRAKTFWVYLGGRLPFQLINTFYNGVIILALVKTNAIGKFLVFEDRKKAEGKES